jgi:hypothetical protein
MESVGSLVAVQSQTVALLVVLVATGAIIPLPSMSKGVRRAVWWLPLCAVFASGMVTAVVETGAVPKVMGAGSVLLAAAGLLVRPDRSRFQIRSTRRVGRRSQPQDGRVGIRTLLVVLALGAQWFATYLAWTR